MHAVVSTPPSSGGGSDSYCHSLPLGKNLQNENCVQNGTQNDIVTVRAVSIPRAAVVTLFVTTIDRGCEVSLLVERLAKSKYGWAGSRASGSEIAAHSSAGKSDNQWTRFSKPGQYSSRNSFLRILPVPPFGKASRNSIDLGTLKPGSWVRQYANNSVSVSHSFGFKTTRAFGTSPQCSSGTAITAHSKTAACE